MKKLLIISDTHQNYQFLQKVLNNEQNCDYIFHLGDDYEDIMHFKQIWKGAILYRVPGKFHPLYYHGENKIYEKVAIDGWRFMLIHDYQDIEEKQKEIDIYCFGHTHHPTFSEIDNQLLINPGHLKQNFHRGKYASYIIASINQNKIKFDFKNINSELIISKIFSKDK